jgi:hypothetical protein
MLGCVFLPFIGLGLFFAVMVIREALSAAATYSWKSETCRILDSEVRETNERSPWFAYLRYTSSAGESVRSSRLFDTYRGAVRFTRRWPVGSGATCYLNPQDPGGTLLERKGSGLVILLFLPIPLLFVFIGAAGFYGVVFRERPRPIVRTPAHPAAARKFTGGALFAVGLILVLAFLLIPVRRALMARWWHARECTILRSAVRQYSGNKSHSGFAPLILYSYAANGEEHRSDVYSFFDPASHGWQASQSIVQQYRRGSSAICYVNPGDPDDATLDRNPSTGWLVGLLPLGLLAGGRALWRQTG